jgi:hypothetical protein
MQTYNRYVRISNWLIMEKSSPFLWINKILLKAFNTDLISVHHYPLSSGIPIHQ